VPAVGVVPAFRVVPAVGVMPTVGVVPAVGVMPTVGVVPAVSQFQELFGFGIEALRKTMEAR
jgi:hypothetical protein